MDRQGRIYIAVGIAIGLLLAAGIQCMTVPSNFDVTVNLSDEDRVRVDALNGNLERLTDAADETLEMFRIPGDNASAEGD